MNLRAILFLIGIALIVLKWRRYIEIDNWWIILIFALWFLFFYLSVHKKNKEARTPRPVYVTNNP